MSDDQHLDLLRTVETIANLVAAAQTEEAAQAEELLCSAPGLMETIKPGAEHPARQGTET